MNKILPFVLCVLLIGCKVLKAQNSDDPQLWLITANISVSKKISRDTISLVSLPNYQSDKEFHQTSQTTANATITAVVENQAENQFAEFFYSSDGDEPVSMHVSGKGTHTSSDRVSESINGKLYSADKRTDHVSGEALHDADIQFIYSEDYKMASVSVKIIARGKSNAQNYFGEWKDYNSAIEDYLIWCDGGCDYSNDKNCIITKTGTGYTASWSSNENEKAATSNGIQYQTTETNLQITIIPYKESENPVITLNGCTNPGIGEKQTVTATAKPEGGSFKFWLEPSDIITLAANDATATLTGLKAGRGILRVEYTTPDGKIEQTSKEASCVTIDCYNEGKAIPQIALFDVNGKKNSGILTVTVKGEPENVAEIVSFVPENPGVLSAVGTGSEVMLQAVNTGKTTLQAKTECGANTGPAVMVEVVNCDDETIATLERIKKAALENLAVVTKKLQSVAGSEEFIKARDELVSSTRELLAKAGLAIIASGKSPTKAISAATKVADKGSALSEIIASSTPEELKNNIGKPVSGDAFEEIVQNRFEGITGEVWGKTLSAIFAADEVQKASKKFGDNIGQLLKHEEVIKEILELYEKTHRDVQAITALQQRCARQKDNTDDQDIPLAELKPIPKEQTPQSKPTPKPETPTIEQPQNNEPLAEAPESDDDILVDPEPPVIPPRMVGLPYEPADCGCNTTKNLSVKSSDFSMMGAGLHNLNECVKNFSNNVLPDYQLALKELSELTETLSATLKTDADAFLVQAKESQPQLDAIVARIKAYDNAEQVFLNQMEKCPESITSGMDILQSVEKITIESIKTNY
ncbi:MAG: hypothetical protein JXB34_12925 [Bacteroidales bacterium]|nr:hypothetical protein [Bacteroidales bacterium]